jgi:predicted ArsR family transcriptional regulator
MDGLSAAQRKVLEALVSGGPGTARELAAAFGVSPVAVRQHLTALAAAGLASPESVDSGVGRPAQRWQATDAAQGSLVDGHAALSAELLRALQDEELADRVLERRTAAQLERYGSMADSVADLGSKIQSLAKLRTEEGYMAAAFTADDGTLCLAENHCPLKCAVDSCLGLCTAELDLFRRFVGPNVQVERTEHIGSGDRRCVYRFVPAAA